MDSTPAQAPGTRAPAAAPEDGHRVTGERLSTDWYGDMLGAVRLTLRTDNPLRAVWAATRLFARSRGARSITTTEGSMSALGLAVLAMLLGLRRRRILVVLQFLPGRKTGLTGRLVDLAYRLFLPRACLGVQVMTAGERETYTQRYRLRPEVVRHIPYYHVDDRVPLEPVADQDRHGILASGRNSCDWDTLLAAAEGQRWPLTLVCPAEDRARVAARAEREGITVLSEIPRAEHNALLARARLFLLVVKDRGASSGHVRVAGAALRRTPVVATMIPGMAGYEHLTVATVPAEDPLALRRVVNDVLEHPDRLADAAAQINRTAWRRPLSRYAAEIRRFVEDAELIGLSASGGTGDGRTGGAAGPLTG